MHVLYIQGRAGKAGAQTCLERLMRSQELLPFTPVLLVGEEGWLTSVCRDNGIPVICIDFPSSRSILSLLYKNKLFANRVVSELKRQGIQPAIIHANDHNESLLGLALKRILEVPLVLFVRSPSMSIHDFQKYKCASSDYIIAVGGEIQERVQGWAPNHKIDCIYDAIYPEEVMAPLNFKVNVPSHLLVIGSHLDCKGWAVFTEALFLSQLGGKVITEVSFTGKKPDKELNDLGLERFTSVKFNFLGHSEDFVNLVRGFQLVVNPSRQETFGMAAVEVVASGVPLLTTRVGVMEKFIKDVRFLSNPSDPHDLSEKLLNILMHWEDFNMFSVVDSSQNSILEQFNINDTVDKIKKKYLDFI